VTDRHSVTHPSNRTNRQTDSDGWATVIYWRHRWRQNSTS